MLKLKLQVIAAAKNPASPKGHSSILCNNLNGKRIQKRIDTCICITDHFAVHMKLTQHC